MLLGTIISALVKILWPKAPAFLADILAAIVPLVIDVVQDLTDASLTGQEKFEEAVTTVVAILDEAFIAVPEWASMDPAKKATIMAGVIELVYFIVKIAGKSGGKGDLRKVARALRRS
jgi:hypothetical protein